MRAAPTMVLGGLLVLLSVSPLGSAASDNLLVTSGIPIKLLGETAFFADESVFATQGAASLALTTQGLELTRVRVESERGAGADGLAQMGTHTTTLTPQRLGAVAVTIQTGPQGSVFGKGGSAQLAASQPVDLAQPPLDVWRDAGAQLSALIIPARLAPELPSPRLGQLVSGPAAPGATDVPAATYQALGTAATVQIADVAELVVADGSLRLDGTTLSTSRIARSAPGSLYTPGAPGGDWSGPGVHTEETVEYFVLHPASGDLEASGALAIYASDLHVDEAGFLKLPWATGTVETANGTVRLEGDPVVLGGELRLRPVSVDLEGAPQIVLLASGEIHYLKVGVNVRKADAAQQAVVATGAVAGLGLLAFAVYFWPALKYAASFVLFPLYARVPKDQIFDHKAREQLYDRIKSEPGVSTNKLAKEVPFGWSTLTYHLRVLERNDAIVSVRDGRYKRFFDRQSGKYSNGKKFVLAVLKNDATLDIAKFILEKPGSSQKEVAGTFALAPSSVHWHVERLSEAGLVKKLREAHNVKYFPGEAWDHVTQEDLLTLIPDGADEAPALPPPAAHDPSVGPVPPA